MLRSRGPEAVTTLRSWISWFMLNTLLYALGRWFTTTTWYDRAFTFLQGLGSSDRISEWRLWRYLACTIRGHEKRHRGLKVQDRLYTWVTCRRCGRHLSGEQPPWAELLSRAVNRRVVAL